MLFKQRDGKKRKNLKYTTLQHSKLTLGEKIPPRKIGREEIGCFLAIERDKASGFSICFILILLFVTYEKKKKKKRPVITVAFMVTGQNDETTV